MVGKSLKGDGGYVDRDRKAIDAAVTRDAELVRLHVQQRDDSYRSAG
jgi:hypothetical protein